MPQDKRKLYMWLAVGGALAAIALIWVASLKFTMRASMAELGDSKKKGMEALTEWENNFKKQMDEMREKFNAAATSTVTTSTIK